MKNIFLVLCLIISSQTFAQSTPDLEFVCELKVTTEKAMILGQTPHGERRIIPITGGTFEGPLLKGIVLSGGADYQYFTQNPSGESRTEIEAIYTVKTDDGVLIHIRNAGLVSRTKEQNEAQKAGNAIDFTKIYFRASPKFDAPSDSKYNWMNNALFICKGIPTGQGFVRILVWKVL
jgi:Protein of unknown function (DUF3237)